MNCLAACTWFGTLGRQVNTCSYVRRSSMIAYTWCYHADVASGVSCKDCLNPLWYVCRKQTHGSARQAFIVTMFTACHILHSQTVAAVVPLLTHAETLQMYIISTQHICYITYICTCISIFSLPDGCHWNSLHSVSPSVLWIEVYSEGTSHGKTQGQHKPCFQAFQRGKAQYTMYTHVHCTCIIWRYPQLHRIPGISCAVCTRP